MDDINTGGHEANRDSAPLMGCTDMGVSKDISLAKKNYGETRDCLKYRTIWIQTKFEKRAKLDLWWLKFPKKLRK